jgi:hypothetical protein
VGETEVQLEVPFGLEAEAKAFVEIVKNNKANSSQKVGVLTAQGKGLDADMALSALLWISSTLAGSLTESWIEEYVWPELKKRIDSPSREFIEWLKNSLKRGR